MKAKALISTVRPISKTSTIEVENQELKEFDFHSWKSDGQATTPSNLNIVKEKIVKNIFKKPKVKTVVLHPNATQCNGTSKRTGFPCKNLTKNNTGYCHHHD
jgi:hypothetical protein